MAKFLRRTNINSQIEEIIIKAKEKLVLITPYVKINQQLIERLEAKEQKDEIEIVLVYGKTDISDEQNQRLQKLNNLTIYYYQDLHAKCYFNEKEMVITSMNLHDYSMNRNREMGVLLNYKDDEEVYADALEEAESIIQVSKLIKKAQLKINTNINGYPQPLKFEHVGNIEKWNEKLLQMLAEQQPTLMFEYHQPSITIKCGGYGSGNVELGITPSSLGIRVVYKFTGKNRSDLFYKIQANCKDVFEAYYPEGVVGWGNQMMRVKLDFTQYSHAEVLRYDAGSLLKIYEYIRKGEEEILKVIRQTGDLIPVEKVNGKNWVIITQESIEDADKRREKKIEEKKLRSLDLVQQHFPEANFKKLDSQILAKDYPIEGIKIDFNGNVGIWFVDSMVRLFERSILKPLEKEYPLYRFFWNGNKLGIYLEKNRIINGQEDEDLIRILKHVIEMINETAIENGIIKVNGIHLDEIEKQLRDKYKAINLHKNEHRIKIYDFPQKGLELVIDDHIRVKFDTIQKNVFYRKNRKYTEIDGYPEMRFQFNNDELVIKDTNPTPNNENGMMTEKYMKTIEVLVEDLK